MKRTARKPPANSGVTPGQAERFAAGLGRLWPPGGALGLAVSGGPDSLALLLLAHATVPGRFAVATVNHGLRAEAAGECAMVERICADRGIACSVLEIETGAGNLQAAARAARYAALADWARGVVPGAELPLLRPLLRWRRAELAEIVAAAGLAPAQDPSNADQAYDRVRVRQALAAADWLDVEALAASAEHLADADAAIEWMAEREMGEAAVAVDG